MTIGQESFPTLEPPQTEAEEVVNAVRKQLGGRKGSKRQAYANMQRAQEIKARAQRGDAKTAPEPVKVSLAERLITLKDNHGFYPTGRIEANQALGLLHDLGKKTSTIKYLNEVFRRQSKETTDIIDPARTTLGLVRQFGNHAADAKITRIILNDLARRLDGVNPNLKLADIADEVPAYMLIPAFRHSVITKAVSAAHLNPENYDDMGTVLDFDYMGAPFEGPFKDAVTNYASSMTVLGVRLIADEADTQQMYRGQFWEARVAEAYNQIPSRDAVRMVGGVAARTYY